jgi:hypothetical protein
VKARFNRLEFCEHSAASKHALAGAGASHDAPSFYKEFLRQVALCAHLTVSNYAVTFWAPKMVLFTFKVRLSTPEQGREERREVGYCFWKNSIQCVRGA